MGSEPLVEALRIPHAFPKSSRLLRSSDFRLYPFSKHHSEHFTFVACKRGQGRLGVSLSRKVLRRAVARNRVRRLLRETFRTSESMWRDWDIHVIGKRQLTGDWRGLTREMVEREWQIALGR